MATGTVRVIGNIMATQRPLDEHYLNEGAAWATTTAALAGIPLGSRSPGKQVNIAGVLYWFDVGLTTLSTVFAAALPIASQVTIVDAAAIYTATQVEAALAEVMTAHNALATTVAGFGTGTNQTSFTILLPASSTIAGRLAGVVTKPTGWTLAASSTVNLLVTHTVTGRKVSSINVWEIDGTNERLLQPFSSAYSGCLVNALTCLIEGLAPTALAIRIEIIIP